MILKMLGVCYIIGALLTIGCNIYYIYEYKKLTQHDDERKNEP